ncbi:acyltransferase family protein [Neorhodopirellula pilleata]|uniref:Glucans biosynthesis protein C n=1 Tax=Neorhodopirellula pilleata TaxID=2714738 RepID=A0A5C6A4K7_9BACT|nr:acyltransferase [Neorhodopirellula pilleata]TWT94882.1 Glucans biosynthesis protein C [Neorhodopirellula pilleata]
MNASPPRILQIQSDLRLESNDRSPLVGLDALRAWSAVAVVVLHASVPYARPAMPGLDWSVTDTPSDTISILFWAIEVVIMPIFLVIAGFLAARSMARSGAMATMKSRLRRWGIPLLLATVVLIPAELYIWLLGWLAEGHITPRKMQSLKFDEQQSANLWGLSHLWFLQYIMTYVVLLSLVWNRLASISVARLQFRVLPLAVVAGVAMLTVHPEVVWGFQHSFLPVFSKWFYSALFFFGGAIWWRCDPRLEALARQGDRMLAVSGLFWVASVGFGIWFLSQPSTDLIVRASLALVTVAAASGLTYALIGTSLHHVVRLSPITQRLASASLMIYLVHHPVVGLAHITAKYAAADVPVWLKVGVVSVLGVGVGVGVDHLIVSHRERRRVKSQTDDRSVLPIGLPTPVPADTRGIRAA